MNEKKSHIIVNDKNSSFAHRPDGLFVITLTDEFCELDLL